MIKVNIKMNLFMAPMKKKISHDYYIKKKNVLTKECHKCSARRRKIPKYSPGLGSINLRVHKLINLTTSLVFSINTR